MENFLDRLNRNPYQPIDSASITRVDELGNGYDDWNNLIAPKFEAPEQTWGETALGVATAPARLATALAGSLSPYGADGWQVPPVAQEGWNALTAVGDAYTQGMSEDEINSRALGMAGFMMGGGGIAAGRGGMVAANASKEGAVPGIASALVPDESGLLDFWHSSPRVFDNFDNTAAATNGGTRGITFFAEKDRAGPGGAINQNFGPNAYNAKVDPTGARILDGRLPFEQLPDDIQDVLSSNPDVVGGWKRRQGAMTFNGVPYDEANPAHYAAQLLNEVGDRQRLIQNLEAAPKRSGFERLLNGPDINEQALDIIRSGKEPTPDTFRPGVPLSDQYSMHNFNGLNLDKLGIDIAINPDEIGLLDPSRIKHLYRNGEQLYSNADSRPGLLASALDMSPEARLARAKEMGFDTSRTLYHGTDRDFESFNPSQSGAYGPGVYVTPDADYANRYAIGRSGWEQDTRIMPLHVRGDMADGMLYESLKREARASGVPDDQIAMVVQQQLQDMGYAGVEGRANQAVTVFDPSNIRSVNAAFDPAKSDSANLLAANADSTPAMLAGALGQDQGVPDWLLPFLFPSYQGK